MFDLRGKSLTSFKIGVNEITLERRHMINGYCVATQNNRCFHMASVYVPVAIDVRQSTAGDQLSVSVVQWVSMIRSSEKSHSRQ